MKLKILLILLILIKFSSAFDEDKFKGNITSFNENFTQAIEFILKQINFKIYRSVNVLSEQSDEVEDFRDAILQRSHINSYIYSLENYAKVKNAPKTFNILIINSFESFVELNSSAAFSRLNIHGQFLLVFPCGSIDADENKEILDILWTKRIYNVYLLYEEESATILTSFWPFRDELCHNTDEVLIGEFSNGSFVNGNVQNIFINDKLKNLNKCTVKVVSFERCPAMCYDEKTDTNYGYDYEIIQELERRLNFTIKLIFLKGFQQWGTRWTNKTVSGGLEVLRKKKADIGFGNYYLRRNRLSILDSTVSYYAVSIVLVVPPGKPLSTFEKLLQPFDIVIWILIVITFSIGCFVIALINLKFQKLKVIIYGEKVNNPMMNMLAAIVGLQQNVLPNSNFPRFILLMFLIFCFVLRNVYQGALFTYMQSDGRHKQIENIDEMIKQKFKFYAIETDLNLNYETSGSALKRILLFEESQLPFNKPVDHRAKFAFMTPLTDVIYRNQKNQKNFSLYIAKEPVNTMSIVMYLSKNFYLKDSLDEKLINFDSAGLISYWTSKHADKRFLNTDSGNIGPIKITLEHLHGTFIILLFGNGLAFVALVIETIYFYWKLMISSRVIMLNKTT